jgi:DNA (cytosine-5)-methyltransferase 1
VQYIEHYIFWILYKISKLFYYLTQNFRTCGKLNYQMKLKENISINEFDGKRYQLRIVEPNNNSKAVLTHYLHNLHNGISKYYKDDALKVLDEYILYKQEEEKLSIVAEDAMQQLLFEVENVPFPTPENYSFKFIDLFAGIGGFRMAMQNLGGKCVFTSEWDKEAQKTYRANYGEVPFGDITKQQIKDYIPEQFDLLCAGFPCQAFSIAGKRGGFDDTRGTLFFDVAEIIKKHKPKAIFLENVKGLRSHDKGKTLETILNVLRNDLGYYVPEPQIVNAKNFGVPQNRERIYIVGFRQDLNISSFVYPEPLESNPKFENVKEENVPPTKYFLSTQYVQTLINHKARHANKGNGFGYAIIPDDGIANAIVVGGMGRERNLVLDHRITDYTPTTHIKGTVNREGIRKMTPREWARLQGFPDNYIIPVADASAYKQFGNSVAVPAIQATANKILQLIGINRYVIRK